MKRRIHRISPRDADILRSVIEGKTYAETGKEFNLSGARIRQITMKAIRTIDYENSGWNPKISEFRQKYRNDPEDILNKITESSYRS